MYERTVHMLHMRDQNCLKSHISKVFPPLVRNLQTLAFFSDCAALVSVTPLRECSGGSTFYFIRKYVFKLIFLSVED